MVHPTSATDGRIGHKLAATAHTSLIGWRKLLLLKSLTLLEIVGIVLSTALPGLLAIVARIAVIGRTVELSLLVHCRSRREGRHRATLRAILVKLSPSRHW